MGVCTSAPPVLLSQKPVDTVTEKLGPDLKQLSGSPDQPIAPVRVFRDEEVRHNILKPEVSEDLRWSSAWPSSLHIADTFPQEPIMPGLAEDQQHTPKY